MKPLVIGGGIGGLTAAIALQQRGIEAHVYEAAPVLAPVGKGIGVPTNALLVLDRLGLADAVAARGVEIEHAEICDLHAGVLQIVDLEAARRQHGRGTVTILRAELQAALLEGLAPGTLHAGKRLLSTEQHETGVAVQFEDGTTAAGDVLIGADGIHSRVREGVAPGTPTRYSGQTCFLGVARLRLPAPLNRTAREVWGGAARFGFSPVSDDLVYWFAPLTQPPGDFSANSVPDELRRLYGLFPHPIPAIIAHTAADDIIRVDLHDLTPLASWYRGRTVLLGDAAHAMTPNMGQGGAQAIEDAYVLAQSLAASASPEAAFAQYERIRRAKVQKIAATSWWLGRLAHAEQPWKRTLRNWALRATPAWVNRRQVSALYTLSY